MLQYNQASISVNFHLSLCLQQPPTQNQEEPAPHPEKRKTTQETPESAKKRKLKAIDVDLPSAPLDGKNKQ